jgi:uncharacterized protein YjbJ (UPF0337 family)
MDNKDRPESMGLKGGTSNWRDVEKSWTAVKGQVQEKWDRFSELELDQVGGNYNRLIGKLQEKYGFTREQAERELDDFRTTVKREV